MKRLRKPSASLDDAISVIGDLVEVVNRLQRISGGPGIEIRDTPGGHTICATSKPNQTLWAKITGCSTAGDGTGYRYVYNWVEVEKAGDGYGAWYEKDNGQSGVAYNVREETALKSPWTVPPDSIVVLEQVTAAGEREFWFKELVYPSSIVTSIQGDNVQLYVYHVDSNLQQTRTVIPFPTYKGDSADVEVVTGVTWDGTNLIQSKKKIACSRATSLDDEIIDTPEACTV